MSIRRQFAGRIGDTVADSTPEWLPARGSDRSRPNVVVVVLDDTGWSDFGCYGSEIATPNLDALAQRGLRFTNFHVTPLCSPTRACLLTGRNNHSVGMRFLAIADSGYPNSRGRVDTSAPAVPALLRASGYGTYLAGKWHLTPQADMTPAGPYEHWPLAYGFDRFYGYLGGASDQYVPELFRDHSPVATPTSPDYHLSADLVDRSIGFLRDHIAFRQDDPFYLQVAFGATHAPFQVPREYSQPYEDLYAEGWDEIRARRLAKQIETGVVPPDTALTERDDAVPAWAELTDEERAVASRLQAVYAGFLQHTDEQIGRLVNWLAEVGQLENTLIAVFSDNGAAGDGGRVGSTNVLATYSSLDLPLATEVEESRSAGDRDHPAHYATGWAMAGNTPFRLYKQFVDLGGVRAPLIVHWPQAIADPGAIRDQFAHVIDLAATAAAAGHVLPDETDANHLHGRSLIPNFADPSSAPARRSQYFEMLGHRAIWDDGWMAVTRHWPGSDYAADTWRLYHTTSDFSQAVDVSSRYPARLAQLQARWWAEAREFGVLPLDDRPLRQLISQNGPGALGVPERLVLRPGQSHVLFNTRLTGSSHDLDAEAVIVERVNGDEGVLLASGCSYGGYVFYVLDGLLTFEHLFLGQRTVLSSPRPIPTGDFRAGFSIRGGEDRSAQVSLHVAGRVAAVARIPTTSLTLGMYGMDVGCDPASAVSSAYADRAKTFPFPARKLREVVLTFHTQTPAISETADLLEVEQ